MYKNIIVAVDGSKVSMKAFAHALDLAQNNKARLTAVTVSEPFEAVAFVGDVTVFPPGDYDEQTEKNAQALFAQTSAIASQKGVECATVHVRNRNPYDGIIHAADDITADLIVIGSHGRRGVEGLLLGSQAVKLLTHTKIPALVVR